MKLISLTICRNSSWSIRAVVEHALQYCDEAVVLVHASTDGTIDILRTMGDRVHILGASDGSWNEMEHRQMTLDCGRDDGGTHFLILDDDEMMAQHLVPRARERIAALAPGELMRMPMPNLWRSTDQYRSDPASPFTRCVKSVAFADSPELHWKASDGYQHHHTHPFNCRPLLWAPDGPAGWLHFQHANWDRLITKQYWYMCMELCRYGVVKANYRGTMDETGIAFSPVPPEWKSPLWDDIDLKATPWQVADIKRMVDAKGLQFFTAHNIPIQSILDLWT